MSRWCLLMGAVGLAVVVLAGLGAAVVLRGGLSARQEPSRVEARLARALRTWAIPAEARGARNPIAASTRTIPIPMMIFFLRLNASPQNGS